MASLATIVRGFVGVREDIDLMNVAVRPRTESWRLRPLANEDVYLYVKRIDNTAVVMFVIAGLFPAAYNTMEGYNIQQLQQEQAQLKQERAMLNVAEAKLLSQ